jgi:hypothetical protein
MAQDEPERVEARVLNPVPRRLRGVREVSGRHRCAKGDEILADADAAAIQSNAGVQFARVLSSDPVAEAAVAQRNRRSQRLMTASRRPSADAVTEQPTNDPRETASPPRRATMDKLVKRVTVIERSGDDRQSQAVTVYQAPREGRGKVSVWTRPFERAARRLVRAQVIFGQEIMRRADESNRRRRDGWLLEGPANIVESGRQAYNEARKAVPFRILPKA